ncbi:MAG: OB-fold domain-containing protein [Syntrophorhabdales bacterium]|jgi:3-hydroxy-3-methylglutaryl CoA synthase
MDIGITAYGVYIPRYRMDRKVVSQAMGWLNPAVMPGEKAVANYDEDSITMAVAASRDCVGTADVGAVYFATTTHPYHEGEGAAIIGTALGLPPQIRTADFGNSLKCATGALVLASETVNGEGAASVLVCASDARLGRPGTANELLFGDAAGAVTLGRDGVIAVFRGSSSVSYDFPDYRRAASDPYVRSVEERFIREEGYSKFIDEAISRLFARYNVKAQDFAKVAFPCLHAGEYGGIGRRLGLKPEQMQAPLSTTIGEMGVASPLVLLVAMLDEAKPGDNLLLAGYGNGADALWFTVTGEIGKVENRGKLARSIARRKELTCYEKYLGFRGMLPIDKADMGSNPPTQLPLLWRERKSTLGLVGSRCRKCGTPQYPPQNICVNPECGGVNEMDDYAFSEKEARLFTYTADNIASTLDPPFLYGLIDFEGGGRFVFEVTDCGAEEIRVGMPLAMSFRKKFNDTVRGIEGYFWKAVPA